MSKAKSIRRRGNGSIIKGTFVPKLRRLCVYIMSDSTPNFISFKYCIRIRKIFFKNKCATMTQRRGNHMYYELLKPKELVRLDRALEEKGAFTTPDKTKLLSCKCSFTLCAGQNLLERTQLRSFTPSDVKLCQFVDRFKRKCLLTRHRY